MPVARLGNECGSFLPVRRLSGVGLGLGVAGVEFKFAVHCPRPLEECEAINGQENATGEVTRERCWLLACLCCRVELTLPCGKRKFGFLLLWLTWNWKDMSEGQCLLAAAAHWQLEGLDPLVDPGPSAP
jgi:hypothetical protein